MYYSRIIARHHNRTHFTSLISIGIISVILALLLLGRQMGRVSGWQTDEAIQDIHVVNVTAHGFELVWTVTRASSEKQWVEWGTSKGDFSHTEMTEQSGLVYHATVAGLHPQTHYSYRLRRGSTTLTLHRQSVFELITPRETTGIPTTPAYGKLYTQHTQPVDNGFILYTVEGAYPLMAKTKQTGEWLIPLGVVIDKKQNIAVPIRDDQKVQIALMGSTGLLAEGTVGQTRPLARLLVEHTFVRLATGQANSQNVLGVETSTRTGRSYIPQIIYPKNHALIPGAAPLIRGSGVPGKSVSVKIQGPKLQYGYQALVDEKGAWLVQYPLALPYGLYTITATTVDGTGAPISLSHEFTIIKSGEQVLGEATGSPTLIPTQTTVPSRPVSTPAEVIPTAVPTEIFVPTISPTPAELLTTGGGMYSFVIAAFACIVVGGIFVLL